MREPLTPTQRKVLDSIERHIALGSPPTMRELCEEFGWRSTNAAVTHLRELERKGWIAAGIMEARGITLLDEQGQPVKLVAATRADELEAALIRIASGEGDAQAIAAMALGWPTEGAA